MLVHTDAIILGGECEAEKVNVLTFLQRSVILSMFVFKFIILKKTDHESNLNTKGAFFFPCLSNFHYTDFILFFSKFNMLRSLKCISVFTSFVLHYSVRTSTSRKFLLNSTVR